MGIWMDEKESLTQQCQIRGFAPVDLARDCQCIQEQDNRAIETPQTYSPETGSDVVGSTQWTV